MSEQEEKYSTIKSREWRQRNPERRKEQRKAYQDKHPQKTMAAKAVNSAVNKGFLPKVTSQSCANPECDKSAQQYHHWAYEPENYLSVLPLCIECHTKVHQGSLSFDSPKLFTVALNRQLSRRKTGARVNDSTQEKKERDSRGVDGLIQSIESIGFTKANIDRLAYLAEIWGVRAHTDGKTLVAFIFPDSGEVQDA